MAPKGSEVWGGGGAPGRGGESSVRLGPSTGWVGIASGLPTMGMVRSSSPTPSASWDGPSWMAEERLSPQSEVTGVTPTPPRMRGMPSAGLPTSAGFCAGAGRRGGAPPPRRWSWRGKSRHISSSSRAGSSITPRLNISSARSRRTSVALE